MDIILLAAGKSSRFKKNKLNQKFLNNHTVINTIIMKLLLHVRSNNNLIVVGNKNLEIYSNLLKKIIFVNGGDCRQTSLLNGLKKSNSKQILIHDAARPFINKKILLNFIKLSKKYDNLVLANKITSSLKKKIIINKKIIFKTMNKNNYLLTETPQIYNFRMLKKNLNIAIKQKINNIQDEYELFELLSPKTPIKIIFHNTINDKITFTNDINKYKFINNK